MRKGSSLRWGGNRAKSDIGKSDRASHNHAVNLEFLVIAIDMFMIDAR